MSVLEEGQKFERYRVIRQLGQGVSGVSYEAEDMMLRRRVTLKLIHPWSPLPDSARRQFFRDMQSISLLTHPYQATTLDYGEVDGQLYTVRRFVPPGSLLNSDGRTWFKPPLAVSAAITYTYQLAQALFNIHRYNHVHGSLTLSNLLVMQRADHSPDTAPFLLADIGMAHFVRRFGHPLIARLPITSAPEQARGRMVPASDQYALAAILYFWLTGRPPFFGSPEEIERAKRTATFPVLTTQNAQVTLEQEGIIRRALSAYPEERYPTILAFADALRASLPHPLPFFSRQAPVSVAPTPDIIQVSPAPSFTPTPPTSTLEAEPSTDREPVSSTFFIDQQTMHYLTSLAKEEEAHATTPAPAEPLVQPAPQPEAEPVSSTFIMDQDGQQRSTERTQQETPSAEPEPQPQIEPDTPAPHPETPPTPEPTPAPQPAPAQEPEPEPEIIPLPEPDIAQPLPDMALPPDIARPMPEPAHTTPTTDALKPIIIQAVVLAQLTITAPSMPEPQVFTLTRTKTTLGRAGSNDILLDKDTLTSRRHAYICREDDQYIIYDDDSIHGIIVNEQKLEPGASHQLTDGDHIRIGEHELIFHMKVPQYISSEQQTSGEHILS